MYDIKANKPLSSKQDEGDANSSSKNLGNVDDDNSSGLSIKYTNSTLRNQFKTMIQ